jgi:kinesin family protein 3/17
MLRELEEQKKEIEREQEERREMQHKIQQMESKLITGGKDIVTHTSEQEQILRQKRFVSNFLFWFFMKDNFISQTFNC